MIRSIAVDLDGTLVHDHEIQRKDREALLKALEEEIKVIPATTRLRISTARFFDDISIDRYPLICNNGARVLGPGWSEKSKFSVWKELKIEPEIARRIASYADKKDYELSTIFPEKVYRRKDGSQKSDDPKVGFVKRNMDVFDHGTPMNFMVHKVSDDNDLDTLLDLENFASENFGEEISLDRHHRGEEYRSLTIYDKEVSKLEALKEVCDRLDVELKEILAIGDDEVDKKMIQEAGIGVAMSDSPQEVKEAADEVVPKDQKNGVAWILDKFVFKV